MVQVHLKRRSSNTRFLLGFLFFFFFYKKVNLQSRVCNCDFNSFNCSSVSIFPSASLDSLVTLIHLSLSILVEFPMQTPCYLQCSSHPTVYPQHSLSAGTKFTSPVLQTDHTDVLPALTAPEHHPPWLPAQTTESDLRTGCLNLERMRKRSRKVSSSLSSFP